LGGIEHLDKKIAGVSNLNVVSVRTTSEARIARQVREVHEPLVLPVEGTNGKIATEAIKHDVIPCAT
jgi:hypothetical protein